MRRLIPFFIILAVPLAASAQQRPLITEEPLTVRPGTMLIQFGLDFVQGAQFPLSGLEGDLTRAGQVDVRFGISRAAELQIQGTIRNVLSVSGQQPARITPILSRSGSSTSDFGDFTVAAKFRLLPETETQPAFGVRFGFEMPNSDERRGIGTNTTNVFFTVLAQKHFGKLNLFGNVGLGILEGPAGIFTQNDVLLYGIGAVYPVHQRVNLVGEVAGRYSTRDTPADGDLAGTGSRSEARFGLQVFAGSFRWDFAGIAGLTDNDPGTGFTFGVTRDFELWPAYSTTRESRSNFTLPQPQPQKIR
jgi:hypothetical protein